MINFLCHQCYISEFKPGRNGEIEAEWFSHTAFREIRSRTQVFVCMCVRERDGRKQNINQDDSFAVKKVATRTIKFGEKILKALNWIYRKKCIPIHFFLLIKFVFQVKTKFRKEDQTVLYRQLGSKSPLHACICRVSSPWLPPIRFTDLAVTPFIALLYRLIVVKPIPA